MATRRTQVFGSLCGLVFLVHLGRVAFAPLVEPLRAAFHLSPGTAGLLVTLAWLGSALPRLPAGYALTRVPRHWVVLAAGAVLTGAAAFTAAAPSPAAIGVGAFVLGLSSGVYYIAANPLVSELFPDDVGRALGIHGTATQLAAVAAPLLVSAILLAFTWRAVFVLLAGLGALATVGVFLAARRADLPDAGVEDRDLLAAVRRQWRLIVTGVVILGITGFVWNGVFNFYVTYLVEDKQIAETTARSVYLTIVFASGVPAFFLGGSLADRFTHVPLLLAILLGFAATLVGLTLATGPLAILAVSVAMGGVIHGLFPAMDTYMLDTMPDAHRASAYAAYSATMMIVQATGSVTVGTLTDLGYRFDDVFVGLAATVVGVAAVMGVLYLAGRLPAGGRANRLEA